jgi:hypothetical protein
VLAARNELADLVAQAEGGLSDRDREVLNLAYRHGLTGSELAQALDVSNDSAKKMVQRLRDTVERSLGALLVVRQANSGYNNCPELAVIVAGWDGQFTILLRKRISRHIESCPDCDYERSRLVNPRALLGASPVLIPAPHWLRENTLSQVRLAPAAATSGTAAHAAGHIAARLSMLTGRFALWVTAAVAIPAIALGVTVGLPALRSGPGPAVQVPNTVPTISTSQQPITPAFDSKVPTPQPIIPTPEPSTAMPPAAGPADTSDPNTTNPGTQPVEQAPSPAPAATVAPRAPAVAPPTHAAPASRPSASWVAPRPQRPSQPTVKHCSDGSTVASGESCPVPTTQPSQPSQPPPCPHIAVENGPVCGRNSDGG